MLIFPKPHFSWNQLQIWERSKEEYRQTYYPKDSKVQKFVNRGMAKGKQMANALKDEELSGDEILDTVIVRLPKLEIMDIPFLVDFRMAPGKDNIIPLWIQPDSYKKDLTEYLEYKTSQVIWTKKMADEHRQIDFYDVGIWIKANGEFIPKHNIVDVRTKKEDTDDMYSKIVATGDFRVIETKRSIRDIIKMMARIKKAVKEISEDYKNYLF